MQKLVFCFVVLMATMTTPALARKSCEPARTTSFAALIRDNQGDLHLLIAIVRNRMNLADLECWASSGDKRMMLALAKRLDFGAPEERDADRAEHLYKAAATTIPGTIYVYTPGFRGKPGRVMPINVGPTVPGLIEADYYRALMHIEARAAKPNYRKGIKMLERLSKSGYAPATEKLSALSAHRT